MTENWTGHYVYGEPYPEGIKDLSVPFYVEWTNINGELEGTCTDDETKMHFDRPATIKGFIDDGIISFIKTYPCRYEIDAAGNVTLFDREPAIDIHYSGTWADDHFEGEWNMTISYQTEDGFPKEYECTGVWALYREGDAPAQSLTY